MIADKHEIVEFEECSLFNSQYEYRFGYSKAVCTCGWKSAPAKEIPGVALVAMHSAHREEARRG